MRGFCDRLAPVFAAALCLVLIGCAGARGPERWKNLPADQSAVIFGTATADETGILLSRSVLHFRNLETGEEGSIGTHPGFDTSGNPDLYERNKRIGWVFELRIPPGRYEFYRYFAVRNLGQFGSTQYHSKQDFSVAFSVEVGQTYYLGEYRALAFMGRNVFGIGLPFGGYFLLFDSQLRDTDLLAKQRKEPVAGPIVNIVPHPDPTSFFLRRTPYGPGEQPPANSLGAS